MRYKVKNILKKIIDNGTIAFVLLFILEIAFTLFITPNTYDDKWFMEQITDELDSETGEIIEHTVQDFIADRYNTWTSRIILEFTLCMILKTSKYIWVLGEALMVVLACFSMSKMLIKEKKKQNIFMLITMFLIYPYYTMHQTGWASTSINYMWTLATCLFAMVPIKKIWDKEKIKWWQYILYIIATIFSANQEQSAAILFGFYLLFLILMVLKDKKVKPFMIIQLFIIILSILFIFTCPGNTVRMEEEVKRFKDFEMLGVLDKFVLGFTSTYGKMLESQNIIYILLTSLLTLYVFLNYKDKLYRIIAAIPLISFLILGVFAPLLNGTFPYLRVFRDLLVKEDVMLTAANCNNLYYTFPIIFSFGNFICIGMSLLLISKNLKNNLPLLIFLAGVASRVMIAFSPTVFISKTRTMIFLDFAMIAISYIIWEKLSKEKKYQKQINIANLIIKFSAVVQVINVLIYIYSKQTRY